VFSTQPDPVKARSSVQQRCASGGPSTSSDTRDPLDKSPCTIKAELSGRGNRRRKARIVKGSGSEPGINRPKRPFGSTASWGDQCGLDSRTAVLSSHQDHEVPNHEPSPTFSTNRATSSHCSHLLHSITSDKNHHCTLSPSFPHNRSPARLWADHGPR
jgi:hypothetical protein